MQDQAAAIDAGTQAISPSPANSPTRVLFASLIGTTIEYFDFYIFGTAAVPKI